MKKLPAKGSFIAYKKARYWSRQASWFPISVLVVLKVPARAERFTDTTMRSRKCRASEAKVLGIYEITPGERKGKKYTGKEPVHSSYDTSFIYKVGKTVTPRKGFSHKKENCASGIHFFMDCAKALRYQV